MDSLQKALAHYPDYKSYIDTLDNQDEHRLFLEILKTLYNNHVFENGRIPTHEYELIRAILREYYPYYDEKLNIYISEELMKRRFR